LRDMDYGRYAGSLVSDVLKEDPELFHRWREAPHTVQFEGGDRLADLRGRIERFIGAVATHHTDGVVLAATHDSPVRVAASLALGLDDSHHNDKQLVTPLASVTILRVDDAGRQADGTRLGVNGTALELLAHNDVSHLRGIDGGV
jgi:broad specificity phosphatase PhoE